MLRLDTTNRSLQIALESNVTANQSNVIVNYSDWYANTYVGNVQVATTSDTSYVEILGSPGASTTRDVDYLSIINEDTATANVKVYLKDSTNYYELFTASLDVGEKLEYTHGEGWNTLTNAGARKTSSSLSGAVTSVGLDFPAEFNIANSPVTTSGNLTATWADETANYVLAAPNGSNGTPSFRALVAADIPSISPLTTKGDLYTFASSDARLAVGSDGQILTANSSATDGIDWATPPVTSAGLFNANLDANGYAIVSSANANIDITPNGTGVTNVDNLQLNQFYETSYLIGNVTGNLDANSTVSISNGTMQTMTLTGNITMNTVANMANGQSMTLVVTQDATGSRLLTTSMFFAGGSNTLSTAANSVDIIVIDKIAGTLYASLTTGYA